MRRNAVYSLLILALSGLLATACASSSADAPDLPDGWQRVQVREGFVGREFANPLAGFTIDLPPGWRAGESWPSITGPSGWIAAVAPAEGENVPTLEFEMGISFGYLPVRLEEDPRYDIRHVTVEGESAYLHLAAPDSIDAGPQVGIYYERIPGGPKGKPVPSLRIEGDSRGFVDQELLARVLQSVRYAEIEELPELPEPGVVPGDDWQRISGGTDFQTFTIEAPPGWQMTESIGIDTLVGEISGDGIRLFFDFGGFAGVPYWHISRVREHPDDMPHLAWEEQVGSNTFWFVKPASLEPDPRSVTGVFAFLGRRINGAGVFTVSVSGSGLSGDQQETVLAMLRTMELETEADSSALDGELSMTMRAEPVSEGSRMYRFIVEIEGGWDRELYERVTCQCSSWTFGGATGEMACPLCVRWSADNTPQRSYVREHTFYSPGVYEVIHERGDVSATVTVEVR